MKIFTSALCGLLLLVASAGYTAPIDNPVPDTCGRTGGSFSFRLTDTCATYQFTDLGIYPCGTTGFSWTWTFGDGGISHEQNPTHVYDGGGYQATLEVKKNGVVVFSQGILAEFTIVNVSTVNLGPDQTICDSVRLTAGDNNHQYLWSTGETTSSINIEQVGTYSVRVNLPNSCFAYDTIEIVKAPGLNPVISHNIVPGCTSVDVLFVDNSTSCDSWIVGRTWDFGDGQSSNERSVTHTYSANGTYKVLLIVRDENGVEDSTEKSVVIQTLEAPTVYLGPDTSYCSAQSVTLNAGNPGSTYSWSNGANSQTISVHTTDDYFLDVTNAHGCSTTDSIHLTISADTLFKVDLGSDKISCESTLPQYQLDAGNAGMNYLWTTPMGTHPTTQTLTTTNVGTYRVAVTDSSGCRQYDSIKIAQYSPVITALWQETYLPTCGDMQFTDNSVYNCRTEGVTWLWLFGDGDSSHLQNPVHHFTQGGQLYTQLTIRKGGQEWHQGGLLREITFSPPVVQPLNDRSFCGSTQLVAGSSNQQYLWSTGDTTNAISVNQSGTYTVRVNLRNQYGSNCYIYDTAILTKTNTLMSVIRDSIISECQLVSVKFTDSSTSCSSNIINRTWDFGDGENSTEPIITHTYAASGTYTIKLTVYDAEGHEATTEKTVTLTKLEKPWISKTDTVLMASNGETYSWLLNGEAVVGADAQYLIPRKAGYYQVKTTDDSGCQAVSDSIFSLSSGVHRLNNFVLRATPNPFRGAITVFLSEVPQRPANVEVLDSRGRLMYRTTMRNNVSTIYPAGLKQGFYILKAIVNGKTVSIPIIVR